MNEFRLVSRQFQSEYDHEVIMEIRKQRNRILAKHPRFMLSGPEPETFIEALVWKLRHCSSTPVLLPPDEHAFRIASRLLAQDIMMVRFHAPFCVPRLEVTLSWHVAPLTSYMGVIMKKASETPSGNLECLYYKFWYHERAFYVDYHGTRHRLEWYEYFSSYLC